MQSGEQDGAVAGEQMTSFRCAIISLEVGRSEQMTSLSTFFRCAIISLSAHSLEVGRWVGFGLAHVLGLQPLSK